MLVDRDCMSIGKEWAAFYLETFDILDIFIAFKSKAKKQTTELGSNKKFQKSIIPSKISALQDLWTAMTSVSVKKINYEKNL